MTTTQHNTRAKNLRLATVGEIAESYPFTEPALRALIFRARWNGLDRAILRVGRRVLIDLEAFEEWLDEHREARA